MKIFQIYCIWSPYFQRRWGVLTRSIFTKRKSRLVECLLHYVSLKGICRFFSPGFSLSWMGKIVGNTGNVDAYFDTQEASGHQHLRCLLVFHKSLRKWNIEFVPSAFLELTFYIFHTCRIRLFWLADITRCHWWICNAF